MKKTKPLCAAYGLGVLLALSSAANADVQLPYGRYIGWVQANGSDRKVALTLDTFLEQPNDVTQFPELDAIVKMSLGGPKGKEYLTEFYANARYDYAGGVLTLSNTQDDLSMILTVVPGANPKLEGRAFIRSSGVSGVVHFDYYDPDNNAATPGVENDAPLLSGQYKGICNGLETYLQIETAKGFHVIENTTRGLYGYEISGRLAVVESPGGMCVPGALCTHRTYHDSNFDLFSGRLVLNSDFGNDTCQVSSKGMQCDFRLGAKKSTCNLARESEPIAPAKYYMSTHTLAVTDDQKAALPALKPPRNASLADAVSGEYIGYLHNESTDLYQVARLNVLAAASTDNPHNENLLYVTGGMTLHFGNSLSSEFVEQAFEPRSFYLVPGFTLESPDSESLIEITDWRAGYISGVWYSRNFGRVGTFEMVKGTVLPPLDKNVKFVPALRGLYTGTQLVGSNSEWWINLEPPNQPAPRSTKSTFDFVGDYILRDSLTGWSGTRSLAIEDGKYDFYTGAISFMTREERIGTSFVTGHVLEDGSLTLFWPSAPKIDVRANPDHSEKPFVLRK